METTVDTADYGYLDELGAGAIFFPRPDRRAPPSGAEDLGVPVDGIELGARFYVAAPEHPTVLYFHGNGEVAPDHDDIAPMYHAIGLNLLVVDFRGYGRSGGVPTFAALLEDTGPVTEWFHALLDERTFSGRRFVMGRSLGAYPALEVAARHAERFEGVVIESGAANIHRLAQRIGAADDIRAAGIAKRHDAQIRDIDLPVLIIHGEADDLVPATQATRLGELLGERVSELLVIPYAGHNDLLWVGPEPYFDAIARLTCLAGEERIG